MTLPLPRSLNALADPASAGFGCEGAQAAYQRDAERFVCVRQQKVPCAAVKDMFDAEAATEHDVVELKLGSRSWMRRMVGVGHVYESCEAGLLTEVVVVVPAPGGAIDPFLREVEESLGRATTAKPTQ